MENRTHIDELIVKCLLNEASREEEARLEQWLSASEENREYYETYRYAYQVSGVQDDIEPDTEWRRFQRSVQKERRVARLNTWAVAASVLFIVALAWYWRPEAPRVQQLVINKTLQRREINTSDTTQWRRLPDGSQIWLSSKSELSWQEPFEHRDVVMHGAARFEVAKDSARPFRVQCSRFVVTVLGTVFTIDAQRVRLYEGKVMVTVVQKKYYLLPGQELVLDTVTNAVTVRKFTAATIRKTNGVQPVDDIPLPYNDRGNWYMFNNQPLSQVLDQLKQIYDVDIIYNEADLQKMYFIGKFGKTDSIETILRQIATLNRLTVVKENDRYVIGK